MVRNKVTKEVKKYLQEIAAYLPKYKTSKKVIIKGEELYKEGNEELLKKFTDKFGYKIERNSNYSYRTEGNTLEEINHSRRLKKAFEQGGMDGVEEYVKPYREVAEEEENLEKEESK